MIDLSQLGHFLSFKTNKNLLSKLQVATVGQIVMLTITTSAVFYKATNLIKITIEDLTRLPLDPFFYCLKIRGGGVAVLD